MNNFCTKSIYELLTHFLIYYSLSPTELLLFPFHINYSCFETDNTLETMKTFFLIYFWMNVDFGARSKLVLKLSMLKRSYLKKQPHTLFLFILKGWILQANSENYGMYIFIKTFIPTLALPPFLFKLYNMCICANTKHKSYAKINKILKYLYLPAVKLCTKSVREL